MLCKMLDTNSSSRCEGFCPNSVMNKDIKILHSAGCYVRCSTLIVAVGMKAFAFTIITLAKGRAIKELVIIIKLDNLSIANN